MRDRHVQWNKGEWVRGLEAVLGYMDLPALVPSFPLQFDGECLYGEKGLIGANVAVWAGRPRCLDEGYRGEGIYLEIFSLCTEDRLNLKRLPDAGLYPVEAWEDIIMHDLPRALESRKVARYEGFAECPQGREEEYVKELRAMGLHDPQGVHPLDRRWRKIVRELGGEEMARGLMRKLWHRLVEEKQLELALHLEAVFTEPNGKTVERLDWIAETFGIDLAMECWR